MPASVDSLAVIGLRALRLFEQASRILKATEDGLASNIETIPSVEQRPSPVTIQPAKPFALPTSQVEKARQCVKPAALLASEAEKFELWAVNLGLFVAGHGSLDYRIREAGRLSETIRRFITELLGSLDEIVMMNDPFVPVENENQLGKHDNSDHDSDDAPSDDDHSDPETDIDLLVEDVRDLIDRLFKVSTRIRNPSTRIGASKAARHKQVDEDSGVDFLDAIESAELDHIRSLFLAYQKARALQEQSATEPAQSMVTQDDATQDQVWEPIKTVLERNRASPDSFLVQRLARANVARRRQFAYWRCHREKLALHTHHSVSAHTPMSPPLGEHLPSQISTDTLPPNSPPLPAPPAPGLLTPSVTTATNLDPAHFEVFTVRSTITVSEYAPSTWRPARDVVDFPMPPRVAPDQNFFECPYCFTICPRSTLAEKTWRAHLIRDLRPYVCTYENCKTASQLYDSRQDWCHHEESCHRTAWRCPQHSEQIFTDIASYKDHIATDHAKLSDDASIMRMVNAGQSTLAEVDRPCPVCDIVLDTSDALQSHLALHLERISLFSLPRHVACDDDNGSDGDSDMARGTIDGSRNDDFDDELEIYSDAGDRDTENTESNIDTEVVQVTKPFKPTTLTRLQTFEDHDSPVYTVAFSPDNSLIASVSDDRVVRIWDPLGKIVRDPFEGHKSGFRSLAWSHDGKTIASGSYDRTIKLWSASSGECLHTLKGHAAAVAGLAFSPDDKILLSGSHDKTGKLWSVNSGTELFTLPGHTAGIFSAAISPNGKWSATGANDKSVRLWDTETGRLLNTLKGHKRCVYALAFSPDSNILATGSNDWLVKIWNPETGQLLRTLDGHLKGVTGLSFSPDGLMMASASYDFTVKIWSTESWEQIMVHDWHQADVYAVAFSHDGKFLATGSRDKTVRLCTLS
ncbi:hypothetical protein PgNI_05861 [Pyricularia grisea]|uniref:C2H2-type domain-containing protein n=1 Tax=Pyricularia grisea TaxID=148305 RepID=A0A6P8B3Q0_PYRGI|nr:hypothetical protein PgNI_05861 [Pyricularia grisea]TLD09898.1 hypothetical protein PgNI_05861 [Pyricularia grisea]